MRNTPGQQSPNGTIQGPFVANEKWKADEGRRRGGGGRERKKRKKRRMRRKRMRRRRRT